MFMKYQGLFSGKNKKIYFKTLSTESITQHAFRKALNTLHYKKIADVKLYWQIVKNFNLLILILGIHRNYIHARVNIHLTQEYINAPCQES